MNKGAIELEKEARFVKKKWRNKGQFRPPSVPRQIPFIYKEKSLYEKIQEQNSKENAFLEESKIRISTNFQKFKGKNIENSSEHKKKFKILAAGDFHGDSSASKRLAEKAEKENVDLVVLTGDITGIIETENLIKPFLNKNKR